MNNNTKNRIRELTLAKIELAGSQNKYATSIGVASSTLGNLNSGRWHLISAEMWRKLAEGCGHKDHEWTLVETASFGRLSSLLDDAQEYANTYAITAPAGFGKTYTARHRVATRPNVYLLECADYWNKKGFLSELLKVMGRNCEGYTAFEMMQTIGEELLRVDRPLIILDEADKLKDEVLYFFITLYNKLEDKCGIVILATDYLRTRIEKGVRTNKRGYNEIFSRINRRFVQFPPISGTEISNICQANGMQDAAAIERVVRESDSDLRRVAKLVHTYSRKSDARQMKLEVANG